MDEQDKQDKQTAEPETTAEPAPESRTQLFKRWGGLVVCTLILIGCALLAGKALQKIVTIPTVYEQTVTIDIHDLYGAWRYTGIAHQWAGATQTLEAAESAMEGTVFAFTEKEFLAVGGQNWSVEQPQYILHALGKPTGVFDDVKAWLGDDVLGYYAVLSAGGTVKPYRIYFSLDQYWIAEYTDNTADGSVVLYDLYQIEKTE